MYYVVFAADIDKLLIEYSNISLLMHVFMSDSLLAAPAASSLVG